MEQEFQAGGIVPRRVSRRSESGGGMMPGGQHRESQRDSQRDAQTGNLLQDYLHTLRRHRWLIAQFALCGIVLSALLSLRTTPVYQTRTSLEIRALNGDFMNMKSVDPTGSNAGGEEDINFQTQIKLLQSETLLQDTVNHMLAQPHPAFIQPKDLASRLGRTLHIGKASRIPYTEALDETARNLKVKPLGLTRLVEISCEGWSPEIATDFCNTLSSTFQEEDLSARSAEANNVSSWLTRQVADIRQRAQDTQSKLETAVGGNGLMLSQTNSTVGEERLRELQQELVRAESDRMTKQAEVGVDRNAAPGTAPSTRDDAAHHTYETKLADLKTQLAALMPPLTEQNPKVIRLEAEIRETEGQLRDSENTGTLLASNELSAALHREGLLKVTYAAQLSHVSSDLQQAAKVSLLRSELESEQQLYQTMLQRAKEAGFASALKATTIRVVDPAQFPSVPSSPRRKLSAIVGALLGALAGTAFAFYKSRTIYLFRSPADIPQYLDVKGLGVIPASRPVKSLRAVSRSVSLMASAEAAPGLREPGSSPALALWNERFSPAVEAYRNATFTLLNSEPKQSGARVYVVSSPKAGEGKTTVTSNLGVALSKSKFRVVLVDADLRKPNLHNFFSLNNSVGLRDILDGRLDLARTPLERFALDTGIPNLSVIPSGVGSEDSVELLHSDHFQELLGRLTREFDIVLIDTPPTLHMVDARIVARESDGVILIVRADVTGVHEAANARDLFDGDGVHLIGTILNDFDPAREGYKNYYSSYYSYRDHVTAQGKAAGL